MSTIGIRLAQALVAQGLVLVGLTSCERPSHPVAIVEDCDAPDAEGQHLISFTKICEGATGIDVPHFDCDNGTLVPETHLTGSYPTAMCDHPNVLNGECDPGSRFQVINQTDDAIVVAHCRKQNLGAKYGDIAVIQYNQKNGATCFYQALEGKPPAKGPLEAKVSRPIDGNGPNGYPWLNPKDTAEINCVRCHDNGPFVRSPYLAQLRGEPKHRLPGTRSGSLPWDHRMTWNKFLPYAFVGSDFQGWKAYSVSVDGMGTQCLSCHRLGISSVQARTDPLRKDNFLENIGTAQLMSITATDRQQVHKNPHSVDSPIWMTPGATAFNQANFDAANAVRSCGNAIVSKQNNPAAPDPPAGCSFVRIAQGNTCRSGAIRGTVNGATQATPTTEPSGSIIDIGTCPSGSSDCPPGFCYWRTLHGPFWRKSPLTDDFGGPSHVGSRLRIVNNNGNWAIDARNDPQPGVPVAPPGGTFECTQLSEIANIPNSTTCSSLKYFLADKDGTAASQIAGTGSKSALYPMTGFIGNIAQVAGSRNGDTLRASDVNGEIQLSQTHSLTPTSPLALGPLAGEVWTTTCQTWSPIYAVKDAYSESDIQLVPFSHNVRCFITGVSGAWSSTRNNGYEQPFAEIYTGPTGDTRLRVSPSSSGGAHDQVGAYASCIKIR